MAAARRRSSLGPLLFITLLAVLALSRAALANGADLPPEIPLQAFVKPDTDRLHLLVRVPLVLLVSFGLPKRAPGYLDLANIEEALQRAGASTGRQIELEEEGVALVPVAVQGRISLLSDRSFQGYETALAHVQGPPLPPTTDLFWNQGFFDVHLEYPIRSARSHFSIDADIAPELGRRLRLQLEFLPPDRPPVRYRVPGRSGRIALDPRWYEAAGLFLKLGFLDGFGFDRLVFLVCLVAPFRRFANLLAVILVMSGLEALTASAIATGAAPDSPFLPALASTTVAVAILLLAIGNVAAPSLRRRWFLGSIVGAIAGFDLGHLLADALQLAGRNPVAAVMAFDVGNLLLQIASLALVFAALRLIFPRVLGPALGVVVLSLLLGHMGWHWMEDESHELWHQLGHVGLLPALTIIGPWMLAALLIGAVAWLLPRGFGGPPVPSLRAALRDRP